MKTDIFLIFHCQKVIDLIYPGVIVSKKEGETDGESSEVKRMLLSELSVKEFQPDANPIGVYDTNDFSNTVLTRSEGIAENRNIYLSGQWKQELLIGVQHSMVRTVRIII